MDALTHQALCRMEIIVLPPRRWEFMGKAGKDAAASKVTAEVKSQGKFPKIIVAHYKAKKNIRKRQGHRQPYTELTIVSIK